MANTFKFGNGEWAVGKETALAYNDENNNFKPLPFTFDRASTATVVNKDGLIETVGVDEPRIDFLNNTNGHLLLEPSRSNELTDSSMNNFSAVRCSRGDEVIKLGIIEGYKYSFTDANPNVNFNYSESTLGYKTFSVFIDATNSDEFQIFLATELSSKAASSTFTPSTRSFSSITENSTYVRNSSVGYEYFGNNIYRIFITTEFILYDSGSTRPLLYFGDNTNVWIGGAQVEVGSYATSYIPTSGSTATRSAEICKQENLPSASIPNSYPFTVFCNFEIVESVKGFGFSFLNIASSTEYFSLGYREDGVNNKFRFTNRISSIYSAETSSTYGSGFYKVAVVFSQTNIKAYINGSEVIDYDHSSASLFPNINDLLLGQLRIVSDTGSRNNVKDLRLYNTALSNSELQALTS